MSKKQMVFSYTRSSYSGEDNIAELNELLSRGWKVVSVNPTSSQSTQGVVFALIVLEEV